MTEVYEFVVSFFQDGGFFIYPIGAVLAVGLAIAIERWVFLAKEKKENMKAFADLMPLLKSGEVNKIHTVANGSDVAVYKTIGCGLDMLKVSRNRADVENAMNEGMLEALPRLEERTSYLNMLANVATLLGLLGTIIGLIGAFTAVANADPAEKAKLLSVSISIAMNTTAFGLMSAIPLLILSSVLQSRTAKIVSSIEMSAVKFLNALTLHRMIDGAVTKTAEKPTVRVSAGVSDMTPVATNGFNDGSDPIVVQPS